MSSNELVIELKNIEKNYKMYKRPLDRLLQMFPWNRDKKLYENFYALKDINLDISRGEVIGLVGQNGAGKSTLLQIVCQTLQATGGTLRVNGRIAALLELGSGFNLEFSGKENVYMAGAIAGLHKKQIDEKYESIVNFSGIGDYIHNAVKTYSSGMMVRLAFAVATSIEPDILVIDEALSVGDGAFARKSFDRIMSLKDAGCTILFCSHSLYQVEVLCDKVMWIDHGTIKAYGEPSGVINGYQKYLDALMNSDGSEQTSIPEEAPRIGNNSMTRIKKVLISSDDGQEGDLKVLSNATDVCIEVSFVADMSLPTPTLGVLITDDQLKNITSCGSFYDNIPLHVDKNGEGTARVTYPKIGLMKGRYYVHVFLMCERAIHIYDGIQCNALNVKQKGSELGVVSLPREWKVV